MRENVFKGGGGGGGRGEERRGCVSICRLASSISLSFHPLDACI